MNEKPSRHGPFGSASALERSPATSAKGLVGSAALPTQQRALYCEIDGLPVEVDPSEIDNAGLFVETPLPAAVDSEVELFLRVGDQRFEARGQVVKSVSCASAKSLGKRPGYAVLFTTFEQGARERERLSAAIASLVAASPRPPRMSVRAAPPTSMAHGRPAAISARAQASVPPTAPIANDNRAGQNRADDSGGETERTGTDDGATASELSLLSRLTDELAGLSNKPPWSVLGISQSATHEELRAAFFDASKRYHPHLYARYAHPDIKRVVTELFIAHKRAYTNMLKAGKSQRVNRP